jgi:hypothetical protein
LNNQESPFGLDAAQGSTQAPEPPKRSLNALGIALGLVRVGLVASLGYCGIAYWLAHEAGAHAVERVGKGLDGLAGIIGPSETVELNGKPVQISSEVVPESVSEVRNKLRQHCSHEAEAVRAGQVERTMLRPEQLLWQELGNDEERLTLCFRPQVPIENWTELGQRLLDVVSSGDVNPLGQVRFARLRAQDERTTHVLVAHTDSGFSLAGWFDDSKDAPGVDPVRAPRPPQARRLLSARVHGAEAGAYGYRSTESPTELRSFYGAKLPPLGFSRVAVHDSAPAQADIYVGEDSFIVLGFTAGQPGEVLVNIVETPSYTE